MSETRQSAKQGAMTRAVAAAAIDTVLTDGRSLDAAFAAAGVADLPARERAFVRALHDA